MSSIEGRVLESALGVLGYDKAVIGRRILQRIVEIGLPSYLRRFKKHCNQREDFSPDTCEAYSLDGIRIRLGKSVVSPSAGFWLNCMLEFAAQWLRIAGMLLRRGVGAKSGAATAECLVLGVGAGDIFVSGSDRRFAEFCAKGPIPVLNDAAHIIVEMLENPTTPSHSERIEYSVYPLFEALLRNPARGAALVDGLLEHCRAGMAFVGLSVRRPIACVLARDLAFHALIAHLNRSGTLGSVVITNSHYHVQPLWLRGLPDKRFTAHMVWYSQNSIPLVYRTDGIRSALPNHRHIELDDIWVWTDGFKNYLRRQGVRARLHAVGPILWHLPEPGRPAETDAGFVVLVFDVMPVSEEIIERIGLPQSAYYYSTKNIRQFLLDVLDARNILHRRSGRKISVVLKHKRAPNEFHKGDYLSLVSGLVEKGSVSLASPDSNLYSLIASANLVIVVPYSSPAYVAGMLGVPALYYDPTGELVPTHEAGDTIRFAGDKDALRDLIWKVLETRLPAQ